MCEQWRIEINWLLYSVIGWLVRYDVLYRVGTCQSVGCTVEGSHPHDVIDKVNAGELEVPEVCFVYFMSPGMQQFAASFQLLYILAASVGIWQSDYLVLLAGRAEGNGDERTNLSSS